MKKIILIIVILLFMQSNSSSVEKQDCANIKKISPKYLSCKIKNLTSKKDDVSIDTKNIKEKKYIIDWFKKKK